MPLPFILGGISVMRSIWGGKKIYDHLDEKAEAERQERDRDRRAWEYYQAVVLLQGKTGVGKDTILQILRPKGLCRRA